LAAHAIHHLSETEALIATDAPLPVGAAVEIVLRLGDRELTLLGQVAGVQEPGWGRPGGVIVRLHRPALADGAPSGDDAA